MKLAAWCLMILAGDDDEVEDATYKIGQDSADSVTANPNQDRSTFRQTHSNEFGDYTGIVRSWLEYKVKPRPLFFKERERP